MFQGSACEPVPLYARCITLLLLTLSTSGIQANNSLRTEASTGDVMGVVVDQAGDVVDSARVILLDATNVEFRRATTDEQGQFKFSGVISASYIVAIQKSGVPLYLENPGYATLNLLGGFRLGESSSDCFS